MKRALLALWLLLSWVGFAQAQVPSGVSTPIGISASSQNVEITLISERAAVRPGDVFHLAIRQKIAPDWHTYWRNPGDSGEPTYLNWTLPDGVKAGEIKWPAPTAIPFGPLVNYGFSKSVVLPVEVQIPASAKAGTSISLKIDATWLECADVCIPGEGSVAITLPVEATKRDSGDASAIQAALASLPKPLPGKAHLTDLGEGGLQLVVTGVPANGKAYFFPHELKLGALVDFAAPQEFVRGKDGFGLNLVKSKSLPDPFVGPFGGVLVIGDGKDAKAYSLNAELIAAAPMAAVAGSRPVGGTDVGLMQALLFAFLGGLILNLMPCVFPILSMKALGLLEASHGDKAEARTHGLWYGFGVLACFLGLAGLLIGLQAAGMAVGWGFQLQSPAIIVGLAVLMVLIGFNLLGFYEIGTSLQGAGAGLASKGGHAGSFFTGVLAVVVAAPCTAPFMGVALGFAATQPPIGALSVFAALGLGFAAPFVALTFMPGLMRALPRPGPWMSRLREALSFPMFATAIWLIWVSSAQVGQAGVLAALGGVLFAGFAVWIWRTWPGHKGRAIALIVLTAGLVGAGTYVTQAPAKATEAASSSFGGEPWTPARVEALQQEGKTVFVNFTADWCVTCKVNEVTVFADPAVREALNGDKAVYLVADWTSRDDVIAKALASHGRVGVPLYLVYKPGVAEPQILPQLLSAEVVKAALN
ncbi:protein-disulfide reductase DsbD [Aquidulcibacter sp.]|uniref:protein-disulfide reductase DsbD family protein n=1 Tax=Aquidulcibacter sp. TaxID=2052990 RepID=UPI0025BD091D|nr:protein-disulfide reductase DsbD domain-containing protein [Aquidulcibacter sp.]MCA3697710.1 thioredoxin family protein [Aquidulcibacter sp.]